MRKISILLAVFFLSGQVAQGAKVNPAYEIKKLPEVPEESALWESASKHETQV